MGWCFRRCYCSLKREGATPARESAELHLPGNPLLAKLTLEGAVCGLVPRPAEPGEFTARAFFNGRMDLTEAEGVASVIAATNARELDAARRLQAGEFAQRLKPIMDELTQMLAMLEAGIDFSEEDIRFLTAEQLRTGAMRGQATERTAAPRTRPVRTAGA